MFQNREEAGLLLADKLKEYKNSQEAIVLAIPRGGVVVGSQIAKNLHLPLSAIVVKKLGAPYNPELAIGAVAPDGVKVIDWDLTLHLGVEQEYLDEEIKKKSKEVEEKEKKFSIFNFQFSKYKIFILVDDGVATGATVEAGISYIRLRTKIILAVPVIAKETLDKLKSEVEQIVALEVPESFGAVGQFYREFPQVSDEEVMKILRD